MTDQFGDFEPDDQYDPSPADPFQVALRLHKYRVELDLEPEINWNSLSDHEIDKRVKAIELLLNWLRASGSRV